MDFIGFCQYSSTRRAQIGHKSQQLRAQINDLPIAASKYQLMIKGTDNFEKVWHLATTGNLSLKKVLLLALSSQPLAV
jgi:hypothetical protein